MDDVVRSVERIDHAQRTSRLLQRLGWCVTALGVVGMVVFVGFWITGDLSAEQAVSLILGTMLATVLSGASAYGSGVNIGLGADRLALALEANGPKDPAATTPPPGRPEN